MAHQHFKVVDEQIFQGFLKCKSIDVVMMQGLCVSE